ncbi:hypothetical protein DFH28DRAFT_1080895 [Melampsora americana]|nr:hypothetical protein DFH28DRAFT_1080895 [Melampsora americana]
MSNTSSNSKWFPPNSKHGPQWDGFLMTPLQENEFFNGKPHKLFAHVKDSCKKMLVQQKSKYLQKPTNQQKRPADNERLVINIEPKKNKNYHGDLQHFSTMSKEKNERLHELLLKAIILGHIPFRFLQNPYFVEYQLALSPTAYTVPTCSSNEIRVIELLKNKDFLTLSLDGWTDCSRTSVYVLLALKGTEIKESLDTLDLHHHQHTSANTYTAMEKSMKKSGLKWSPVCAVVTDSLSPMIVLRKMITGNHPHIIGINSKDILEHPLMVRVVASNWTLVNFFRKSTFWSDFLERWRQDAAVTHGLSTVCETHWYSMAKVCLSVAEHEDGFKKALTASKDRSFNLSKINKDVAVIISDCNHFTANQALVTMLKSVVLTVFCALSQINIYSQYEPFKKYAESVLHLWTQVVSDDIYIIAFFISLDFRNTAISRKIDLLKMNWMICNLAARWGFTAQDGYTIKDKVVQYYNSQSPFQPETKSLLTIAYWLSLPVSSQQSPLKQLAIEILQIGPHAAGVESVFSDMGTTKTKLRPWMNIKTLKMCTQTQKDTTKDNNIIVSNSDLTDNLEYFEEGVFADMDPIDPSIYIDETGFITTLFDFQVFEKAVQTKPSNPPVVITIPDDLILGATWSANDLFK